MNDLRECSHKEILLARFIVGDDSSKLEFAMCNKCWNRLKRLKGFTLIEQSYRKLESKAEQARRLQKVPF